MFYLTDPGFPGTFQTWRPPKSLISPSSGELSPLQSCAPSKVIRRRCSFHQLLTAVSDSFRAQHERAAALVSVFFYPENLRVQAAEGSHASSRLETERSATATATLGPLFFPQTERVNETAAIADSQELGWNCLSYLEEKTRITPSYTPPVASLCRVSAVRRAGLRTVRADPKLTAVFSSAGSLQSRDFHTPRAHLCPTLLCQGGRVAPLCDTNVRKGEGNRRRLMQSTSDFPSSYLLSVLNFLVQLTTGHG